MSEIYLVRHPESALNTKRSIVGGRSNETPITLKGEQQARQFTKAFLANYPSPDVYFASPAVRTQKLMQIYSETLGQPIELFTDDDLQEMSQGSAEGMLRSEVYTPEVLEQITQKQKEFSLPNGESVNNVCRRMSSWAIRTACEHPNSVILAATHGQAIRALVGGILGWSQYETTIDPTRITPNVSLSHLTVLNDEIKVNFWGKEIVEAVETNMPEVY
jgi:broad specificity phosphatase PhoE